MTHFISLISPFLFASSLSAAPYCESLLSGDALPPKYAKLAPIFSDDESGWIFTQDQLKDRYDMKQTSRQLVHAIVDEFAKRDVQLAIVIPPPRPIVAGQEHLDAAMGEHQYDVRAARVSFDSLISQLRATGAIVPNLSQAALSDMSLGATFYFRRDTHWTTVGSAMSAIALAKEVSEAAPSLFPNDGLLSFQELTPSGAIEEPGSLSKVINMSCKKSLPLETSETFKLSRGDSLLGSTATRPSIALVGSSFSNRYKRDHYRFADAMAFAFDADVANLSVSGGGPIGAIEAYVLSGALDRREHPLVVWEMPYSESFNSQSFLRQLLGALRKESTAFKDPYLEHFNGATLIKSDSGASLAGIEIGSSALAKQSFKLEVRFDNGSTSNAYVGRRNSVPANMRSDKLFFSLTNFGGRTPLEVVITPLKGAGIAYVRVK